MSISTLYDQFKGFLNEIECPVCNEYLHTNIPVCSRGHSICVSCKKKCSKCPTCQSTYGDGRNYVLENLISSIRIPCKYKTEGCKHQRNFVEIATHMKECEYRDFPCPLNKSHNCTWLGNNQKFQYHLKETHKSIDWCYTYDIETSTSYMFHGDHLFKIYREFTTSTGLVTWVVQFLGNHKNAKEYLFKIEFMDHKNSGMELSMTAECVSMCNVDNILDNVGITFPAKMLEYFKFEDIYTHRISIQNKKSVQK